MRDAHNVSANNTSNTTSSQDYTCVSVIKIKNIQLILKGEKNRSSWCSSRISLVTSDNELILMFINRAASVKAAWEILESVSSLTGNDGECQQIHFIFTKSDLLHDLDDLCLSATVRGKSTGLRKGDTFTYSGTRRMNNQDVI